MLIMHTFTFTIIQGSPNQLCNVYTFAFIHYLLVVEGEVFSRTRNVATPYITPILLGESCSVCLCVCVSVYAPTSTQLSSPDAAARCSGVFRAWWERARDIANLVSGVWELYHQFPGSSPQLLDCCCAIPKAGRPANISTYQLMIIFCVWLLHIVYIAVVWASDVRLCVASVIAYDIQAREKLIVNSGMPHDNSDYTITPLHRWDCCHALIVLNHLEDFTFQLVIIASLNCC